jgi:hypothetical protein
MRREDWRHEEAERLRRLRDSERRSEVREDYGQADYSDLYGYDPRARTGYRAYDDGRREPYELTAERSFAGRPHDDARDLRDLDGDGRRTRRDGPSDRVLWAVITERLEDERRLDLSDVDLDVRNGEVFLYGTVRHKADKRRIEDVADIEGVRNVQNNLRLRERRRWSFI